MERKQILIKVNTFKTEEGTALLLTWLLWFSLQVNFGSDWRGCTHSQNRDRRSCRSTSLTGEARPCPSATPSNWTERKATMPCTCSRPHPASWRTPWPLAPKASRSPQQTGTTTLRRMPTVPCSCQVNWFLSAHITWHFCTIATIICIHLGKIKLSGMFFVHCRWLVVQQLRSLKP